LARTPDEVQKTILKVTRHGPKIESLYMLSCFVLAFDMHRPDLCEAVTVDGMKAVPQGWRIPMTQGFIDAFNLKDPARAAMYYGLAASRAEAPPYLGTYAAKLVAQHALSVEDLQASLAGLLGAESGSRFADVLTRLRAPGNGGAAGGTKS
jgi:hypothetical protein